MTTVVHTSTRRIRLTSVAFSPRASGFDDFANRFSAWHGLIDFCIILSGETRPTESLELRLPDIPSKPRLMPRVLRRTSDSNPQVLRIYVPSTFRASTILQMHMQSPLIIVFTSASASVAATLPKIVERFSTMRRRLAEDRAAVSEADLRTAATETLTSFIIEQRPDLTNSPTANEAVEKMLMQAIGGLLDTESAVILAADED